MSDPRRLSQLDATLLVMGGILGVGIFFNPATVARAMPDPTLYLAAWAVGAVAALCGAMTFAELSAAYPRTGGWYVFLREGFGRLPAFLFAWVTLFVVSTGACALVARFFGTQVASLIGEHAPSWTESAAGAAALIGITSVAFFGIKTSALVQNAVMLLKLGAVATFVAAGLFLFDGEPLASEVIVADETSNGSQSFLSGLLASSLAVLFSYGGWQLLSYVAPDVRDPQRTLPRAILFGVAGVSVVYFAINASYLRVMGIGGIAEGRSFIVTMAERSLGSFGATFLTAAMAVSAFGFLLVTLSTTPGVYVAMSREGLFPRALGHQDPRTGAPRLALATQLLFGLGYLAWSATAVDALTGAVVFAEWIFHALCGLALIRLNKKLGADRPFRSWLFPLFPATYAAIAIVVVVGNLITNDREVTMLGLGVLGLGLLIYVPWTRLTQRAQTSRVDAP